MAKAAKPKTKATTTKKTTVKKPTAKRPVTKRTVSKRTVAKRTEEEPFMQFKLTQQTLHWIIFGAVSIAFALWIYSLDAKVRDLYDQADANISSLNRM